MSQKTLKKMRRRSARGVQAAAFALNRQLNRFDDKLFVLGEGRSGTTWLANLLNFDGRYRLMFEPFLTGNFRPAITYSSEYPFPDKPDTGGVQEHIRKVLRGDYISGNANVTSKRLLYQGMLIKDITAQLILDQIFEHAPAMKGVFILRHPFAVASSKSKVFKWPTDPLSFLSDNNTRRGEIEQFSDQIEKVAASKDPLLIHVLVWCLSHWFAFHSRSLESFALIYYEELVVSPETELPRLFERLNIRERYDENKQSVAKKLSEKSHVTFRNNVIAASKKGQAVWDDEWDKDKIDSGLELLERFGFSERYSDRFSPLAGIEDVLPHIQRDARRVEVGNQ